LTLLNEEAITRLVCLHAKNESIEIQLSALAQSNKSAGAHVYRLEHSDTELIEIRKLYADGLINIQLTCRSLGAEGAAASPDAHRLAIGLSRSYDAVSREAPSAA
jgi:hypothetical protein